MNGINFSVFTKPWKEPIGLLAERIAALGFDGIELPVRPGYPITPETVHKLPEAVAQLRELGVSVYSIAGPTDEPTFAACAEAGVPLVRIMAPILTGGYIATEHAMQHAFDAMLPLLEKYDVKVGVQNHYGRFVSNSCGLRSLVSAFDPRRIGIVWDAAHNALNGEEMELGIEIVWSHLCMVNLKNARWLASTGQTGATEWHPTWVAGSEGQASWKRVAAELDKRKYEGVVCLTAEYSAEHLVESLVKADLAYARSLFA